MERYKFNKSIKQEIKTLSKLDNFHGFIALLMDYIVILAAVLLTHYKLYLYPLSLLLIGSRQRALATILHEASHGTLFRSHKLNKVVGSYFSGYLVFQSWNTYKTSHVRKHHYKLGKKGEDPDYDYYLSSGVYESYSGLKFFISFFLKPIFLGSTLESFRYLVKNRLLGSGLHSELFPMLLSAAIFATVGSILFGLEFFILFWLIPYFTTFQILTWFIELSEHYPMVADAKIDIYATRNRFSHPIEHFFTGTHNENFHLIHHLFPSIPFWNMKQAHRILLQDETYLRINSEFGGILFSSNYAPSMWEGLINKQENLCQN